jgi:predicted nucleotidyltransferase
MTCAGTATRGGRTRPSARRDGAPRPRYDGTVNSEAVHEALTSYRERLERELPGQVRRVVLFGSWARGEAHEDSDVDILVVLSDGAGSRAHAIDIGGMLALERGLVIAPLVLAQSEWDELLRRERRLATEIQRDGVEA